MTNKTDNSPAFPVFASDNRGAACNTVFSPKGGLSLRDYFAAAALQGTLAFYGVGAVENNEDIPDHFASCAENAFAIADAMLKAREA